MNIIICVERIGKCMKEEFVREFSTRRSRIQVNKEIFVRNKERIWRRK